MREVLGLGGAAVGAIWGYFLGRAIERRLWVTQVGVGFEAMERVMKSLGSSIEFIRSACEGMASQTRGSLTRASSSSPDP